MERIMVKLLTRWMIVAMLFVLPSMTRAQDFLSTRTVTFNKSGKGSSFKASVEFPTEGDARVVSSVMKWIGFVLDTETDFKRDYQRMLQASCDTFTMSGQGGDRSIVIERSYEDANCVTFESMVTDKGSETWRWADCASFSKRDGHRIRLDEIFRCDISDIQQLMWAYRGDLPMSVDSPEELVPVNAGFIDGWVIVIGQAYHYTGAPYRLRYEEIDSYLHTGDGGYY